MSGNRADSQIEIRRLQRSDSIGELTELLHRAYAGLAARGLQYTAVDQSESVTLQRVAEGECYVAVNQRRVVGTIMFKPVSAAKGSPWLDRPDVASFAQFAVDPSMQFAGIGSQLLGRVEARAGQTGAREIALDTAKPAEHLIRWYMKCGYRLIEHLQWKHTNYRSVVMSKSVQTLER